MKGTNSTANIHQRKLIQASIHQNDSSLYPIVKRLKLENKKYKTYVEEQKQFKKDVDQVAHDIRSPLTSLQMLAKFCTSLSEEERDNFVNIATTISDIANNLLDKYNPKKSKCFYSVQNADKPQPISISLLLSQLLDEKKYQYKQSAVKFELRLFPDSHLIFINAQPVSLKRALSNIINNAVDAFDGSDGIVTLSLAELSEQIVITVDDNGSGMPDNVKNKIMSGICVTEGKYDGHGIGMEQVRGMLQRNNGKLEIDSVMDQGTSIKIIFDKIAPPEWSLAELTLHKDDILVILDNNYLTHSMWNSKIGGFKKSKRGIKVKHFKFIDQLDEFINNLSARERQQVYLCVGCELESPNINGVEVIKKLQLTRSLLVINNYYSSAIHEECANLNIKILPKQLIADLVVKVVNVEYLSESEKISSQTNVEGNQLKHVDLVIVDDDELLLDTFAKFLFKGMLVDTYVNPYELFDNILQYPLGTKIAIDNNYKNISLKGVDIAQKLYDRGYTSLYILSGEDPENIECDGYATALLKTDIATIQKVLSKPM